MRFSVLSIQVICVSPVCQDRKSHILITTFNPACGGNIACNRFALLLQKKVCAFGVWTVRDDAGCNATASLLPLLVLLVYLLFLKAATPSDTRLMLLPYISS